jgi:hypothetical protein
MNCNFFSRRRTDVSCSETGVRRQSKSAQKVRLAQTARLLYVKRVFVLVRNVRVRGSQRWGRHRWSGGASRGTR